MQQIIRFVFTPIAFALGFIWPLVSQLLVSADLVAPGWSAIAVGAVVAIAWGLMAQFRGSWIWIK